MRDADDESLKEQLRKDPRRDPTDPPPAVAEAKRSEPSSKAGDSPADPGSEPPIPEMLNLPGALPGAPAVPNPPITYSDAPVITVADPRLNELEPHVAAANWEAVLAMLGSPEDAKKLPPNLGLVYALAHKELNAETTDENYEPNLAAIQCMAHLFGVPADSPYALVLGKRIIRSNPVSWQKKKAPPAHISVLIVALGLLFGAGIGLVASYGQFTFKLTLPFLP